MGDPKESTSHELRQAEPFAEILLRKGHLPLITSSALLCVSEVSSFLLSSMFSLNPLYYSFCIFHLLLCKFSVANKYYPGKLIHVICPDTQ